MEQPKYLNAAGCLVNPAVATSGITVCVTNYVAFTCGWVAAAAG